jgi:subtilisin family serine protease
MKSLRHTLKTLHKLRILLAVCFLIFMAENGGAQANRELPLYRLIKFSSSADLKRISGLEASIVKRKVIFDHPAAGLHKVRYDAFSDQELQALLKSGDILYFENDAIGYGNGRAAVNTLPNDPEFSRQWYLNNDGTFFLFGITPKAGADINTLNAWQLEQGDSTITVAILDTGINPTHQEFTNRLWKNRGETPGNGKDDDKNGYIDDVNGWDFVNERAAIEDDGGHGTALAGVIAANVNNDFAYAGINRHCKLMICKVLQANQSGLYSDWTAGIYYAVDEGADIINMSVSGETNLRSLHEAIQYAHKKGVLIVCSMGNNKTDLPYYPAGYEETLATGSTDANDKFSLSFSGGSAGSNFGSNMDIVAPGNGIYGLDRFSNSINTIWSGTSMSAAVVTGVASLLLSSRPNLSPNELKGLLLTTANDQVGRPHEDIPGWDVYHGFGRVNAFAALNALQSYNKSENPFHLTVYPNPAHNEATVSILLSSLSPVSLLVTDPLGKRQLEMTLTPSTPDLNYSIDLSNWAPAMYVFTLQQGGKIFRYKVIRG